MSILAKIVDNGGFIDTKQDIADLAAIDRLRQVLVRCGCCRFTCAVQDVNHLLDIIKADGRDYVRDVSLLAGDPAFEQVKRERQRAAERARYSSPRDEDLTGVFDGVSTCYSDADPGL